MKYNYIVLLTDFGYQDNFIGVMEGMIYKTNPHVKIINLTHNITPQNVFQAAFLLEHSFPYFPDNTLFLNVVDPGVGTDRDIIILKAGKKIFIAPDNGLLSFIQIAKKDIYKLIIPNKYIDSNISNSFHGRDIFSPIAGAISKGIDLKKISIKTDKIITIKKPEVSIKKNKIIGEVVYIDNFGNLITNINKNIFFNFVSLKDTYKIKIKNNKIKKISNNYIQEKGYGALFNSFNLLEIFSPNDNASYMLKAGIHEEVSVYI